MNLRNTLGAVMGIALGVIGMCESSVLAEPPPRQLSASEQLRAVERLAVVGNVLYVAAHPDDENTRLLAYLVAEKRLRTAYLSITRGDGGQNLIGAEQGPLLGLIRTQELLAARRVDGAEQLFTRARDFGYSKTPTETMNIWGKDAVLSDVVWQIRRFRPDLIITRFPTGNSDTHGHHIASAILAEEAFRAAADPAFAPEQVKQLGTWQAKRIVWNRSLWGGRPSDDLSALPKLDIGGYDALSGLSYGELSSDSRSMHKSQGFGAARSRGPSVEYFQDLGRALGTKHGANQAPAGSEVFVGIDWTWGRVPGTARLVQLLEQARKEWAPHHPEAMLPTLLQARAELSRLPDNPWKEPKLRELNDLLVGCAGLFVEAAAAEPSVAPGGSLPIALSALNRSTVGVTLQEVRLVGAAAESVTVPVNRPLPNHEPWQREQSLQIPASAPLSNPYWLSVRPDPGLYRVTDPQLIGQPENTPSLVAEFHLLIRTATGQEPLVVRRSVHHKWTDPVAGERYRSIEIWPVVMVNPDSKVLMFGDAQPHPLRVRVKAGIDHATGTVKLDLPPGFVAEPASLPFTLEKKGAEEELRFQVKPAPHSGATQSGLLRVQAEISGQTLSRGLLRIDHSHIPIQTLFPEATVQLARFDLKRGRSKIGYIAGAGDEVGTSLRQVGYDVTILSDEALERQPLHQYGAIVVGVRAYNVNQRLAFFHRRLMEYVAAGGNLVVQYNTSNRLGKLSAPIGPLPFEISQDRVTDENATVTIEQASHPLLHRPNRITDADFAGWVQERGLYFAGHWDPKYETPLSLHDPGEPPKKGSLLVVRHGKGAFLYTGLAFFRQLPAGVAGAYRLLANLISYGQ